MDIDAGSSPAQQRDMDHEAYTLDTPPSSPPVSPPTSAPVPWFLVEAHRRASLAHETSEGGSFPPPGRGRSASISGPTTSPDYSYSYTFARPVVRAQPQPQPVVQRPARVPLAPLALNAAGVPGSTLPPTPNPTLLPAAPATHQAAYRLAYTVPLPALAAQIPTPAAAYRYPLPEVLVPLEQDADPIRDANERADTPHEPLEQHPQQLHHPQRQRQDPEFHPHHHHHRHPTLPPLPLPLPRPRHFVERAGASAGMRRNTLPTLALEQQLHALHLGPPWPPSDAQQIDAADPTLFRQGSSREIRSTHLESHHAHDNNQEEREQQKENTNPYRYPHQPLPLPLPLPQHSQQHSQQHPQPYPRPQPQAYYAYYDRPAPYALLRRQSDAALSAQLLDRKRRYASDYAPGPPGAGYLATRRRSAPYVRPRVKPPPPLRPPTPTGPGSASVLGPHAQTAFVFPPPPTLPSQSQSQYQASGELGPRRVSLPTPTLAVSVTAARADAGAPVRRRPSATSGTFMEERFPNTNTTTPSSSVSASDNQQQHQQHQQYQCQQRSASWPSLAPEWHALIAASNGDLRDHGCNDVTVGGGVGDNDGVGDGEVEMLRCDSPSSPSNAKSHSHSSPTTSYTSYAPNAHMYRNASPRPSPNHLRLDLAGHGHRDARQGGGGSGASSATSSTRDVPLSVSASASTSGSSAALFPSFDRPSPPHAVVGHPQPAAASSAAVPGPEPYACASAFPFTTPGYPEYLPPMPSVTEQTTASVVASKATATPPDVDMLSVATGPSPAPISSTPWIQTQLPRRQKPAPAPAPAHAHAHTPRLLPDPPATGPIQFARSGPDSDSDPGYW